MEYFNNKWEAAEALAEVDKFVKDLDRQYTPNVDFDEFNKMKELLHKLDIFITNVE